jgi:NAD(P)H-hydrate epimerase
MPRDPESHKGHHGHALLLAGNKGRMGAALLAARACLRTGVGLLTVNVPEAERPIMQTALPEAMLMMREDGGDITKFGSIGIGPGLGLEAQHLQILENILDIYQKPIVIDADAITLLSEHKSYWKVIPPGSILTPHPAEFDRMFGPSEDNAQRVEKALSVSLEYPWIIVLKNHRTVVAENGNMYTNTTGNAGLAKGGSGDVLTGMILSFLAQHYEPLHAACAAVYLHGLAADIAINDQPMESLLASDVIEHIGKAFLQVL